MGLFSIVDIVSEQQLGTFFDAKIAEEGINYLIKVVSVY